MIVELLHLDSGLVMTIEIIGITFHIHVLEIYLDDVIDEEIIYQTSNIILITMNGII